MKDKVELTFGGLFFFSIPSILGSLLEPISGVVDSALIGNRDTHWLAALSIGVILLSSFTWVFNFLIHTSTQAVSESFARNDHNIVVQKIKVALLLSFIIGVLSSIGLYIFRIPLFLFTGATDELLPLVEDYFNIRLLGQTFLIISFTSISILRGLSRVKESFYLIFLTTIVNISSSWYLLNFTELGISSVAWGTVLAGLLSMIIGLALIFREEFIREKFFEARLNKAQWIHFGKNSFNMFCRSMILTSCFFLSTKCASRLGAEGLAAHQIILELWLISSFLIDGVAITANIMAAKFKGEGSESKYQDLKKQILLLSAVIGLSFTLIYFVFSDQLWNIFSNDELVFAQIRTVWPYIALSQMLLAVSYIYDGLLFGLERFSFLRKQMFIAFFVSYLPFILFSIYYNSFVAIWLGMISLGVYRLFMGYFGTKSIGDLN
ncbi:MATE family efflux transporter [Halobacteriovorax sp. HLS]|uniref:MATE family efflux transporter n=1 Tax=Halobacteriovorax sp. HLS TaxID=2234000 RepID=UPI000FD9B927|nr:MATE family efflux transporter [Halobacteriovorax sp. HLS]